MKEIPLTQGKVALVSDEDFEWLSQFKWHVQPSRHTFYAVRNSTKDGNGNRTQIRMHRVIMKSVSGEEVDHKDGNGLNNSRENLRVCKEGKNSWNQRKVATGSSKFKGVSWHIRWKYWAASIQVNKRAIILVRTRDEIAAARIYDAAARKFFGEFACTNFPFIEDNLEKLITEFRIPKKKSSKFPGVYGSEKNGWLAMYFKGKTSKYIGRFKSEQEAARAFVIFMKNFHTQDAVPLVNAPIGTICP